MPHTHQILSRAQEILPNRHELNILLAYIFDCSYESIVAQPPAEISTEKSEQFLLLVKKRAADYPLAYILESQPFCGRDFFVNEHVLIPRPETEMLVEKIIDYIKTLSFPRRWESSISDESRFRLGGRNDKMFIADIGTGSGAIAVTLAKALPHTHIIATDASVDALTVAQKNAAKHNVADRITFLQGNLLEPIKKAGLMPDIIAANLPYLPLAEINHPAPNGTAVSADEWQTIKYEPQSALIGGEHGDELIRECLTQAAALSPTTQALFFESEPNQLSPLVTFAQKLFPHHHISIHKDLSNQDRFLMITK